MYLGKLYDRIISKAGLNPYSSVLQPLPVPKLVVLYNGERAAGDEAELTIGDAFKEEIRRNILRQWKAEVDDGDKAGHTGEELEEKVEAAYREASPDIEVRVRMVNINHGRNAGLMVESKPLREYAWFVDAVRKNSRHLKKSGGYESLEAAIDLAIDQMPKDFVIRDFLIGHRAEVKDMCLTEYNEAETMNMFKEEGRKEGIEEGIEKGRKEGVRKATVKYIRKIMKSLNVDIGNAMDILSISDDKDRAMYIRLINKKLGTPL